MVKFPIDEEYELVTNFTNDSLLAFYCKSDKKFRIYNHENGNLVSESTIRIQGEDFALLSTDSILILDNSQFYLSSKNYFILHFLNIRNNKHDSIVLSSLHFNNQKLTPDAIFNELDIQIKNNKDILIPCFSDFNPEEDSIFYEKWFALSPDLKLGMLNGNVTIKPFGSYPKDIAKYTKIFYPYRMVNDRYTIYSHPYSSFISVIDNHKEAHLTLALKSIYIPYFENIPFDKLNDKYFLQNYYLKNPMYYKLLYSKYRDEYYRIVYYKFDSNGKLVKNFKNKSWGIIRFRLTHDEPFILDEKEFDGRIYDASQSIVTSKGILLQKREKLILNDTIKLSYDLLQY